MSQRFAGLFPGVVALAIAALVAAACGGGGEEATPSPAATPAATAQATPAVTPLPTQQPGVPGVTATKITLGAFTSLTGPAAAYAVLPKASQAYFAYINAQGGVYGKQIEYILCDDAFNPTQSVQCAKKLVEQDNIFAAFCNLGGPGNQAALPYLDEQGVPSMFICANNAEFVTPLTGTNSLHFMGAPTYLVDGKALADYVLKNLPGKKIGFLVQTTGFGADVEKSAKEALGSGAQVVGTEKAESSAADLSSQVLNLKGAGAEVVIVAVLPNQAANAIKVAAQNGWKPAWLVAEAGTEKLLDLIGDPSISDGIIRTAEFRSFNDLNDANVKKWHDLMAQYGEANLPFGQATAYGWCRAEMMVEALKLAGPNLTREGLVKATEKLGANKWACSLWLPGLTAAFSPTSHEALATTKLQQAKGSDWVALP